MTRRGRLILAVLGLLVVGCSLIALAYVWWPLGALHAQATLVPTLFSPP